MKGASIHGGNPWGGRMQRGVGAVTGNQLAYALVDRASVFLPGGSALLMRIERKQLIRWLYA